MDTRISNTGFVSDILRSHPLEQNEIKIRTSCCAFTWSNNFHVRRLETSDTADSLNRVFQNNYSLPWYHPIPQMIQINLIAVLYLYIKFFLRYPINSYSLIDFHIFFIYSFMYERSLYRKSWKCPSLQNFEKFRSLLNSNKYSCFWKHITFGSMNIYYPFKRDNKCSWSLISHAVRKKATRYYFKS